MPIEKPLVENQTGCLLLCRRNLELHQGMKGQGAKMHTREDGWFSGQVLGRSLLTKEECESQEGAPTNLAPKIHYPTCLELCVVLELPVNPILRQADQAHGGVCLKMVKPLFRWHTEITKTVTLGGPSEKEAKTMRKPFGRNS